MTMLEYDNISTTGLGRRDLLQAGGAAIAAGLTGAGPAMMATREGRATISSAVRNAGPLGLRLQGVQHFGLTVQNIERAYEFYTEIYRDPVQHRVLSSWRFSGRCGAEHSACGSGDHRQRTGSQPRTVGVPDLRGGAQRLDVRFILFDNVVIELVQALYTKGLFVATSGPLRGDTGLR
jgi:hypothetical protein